MLAIYTVRHTERQKNGNFHVIVNAYFRLIQFQSIVATK